MFGCAIKISSPYTEKNVVVLGREGKPSNLIGETNTALAKRTTKMKLSVCMSVHLYLRQLKEQRSRTNTWMDCMRDPSSGGIQSGCVCVCLCCTAWVQEGLYQKLQQDYSTMAQCTFQQLGRLGSRSNYWADQASELKASMLHNLYINIFH